MRSLGRRLSAFALMWSHWFCQYILDKEVEEIVIESRVVNGPHVYKTEDFDQI